MREDRCSNGVFLIPPHPTVFSDAFPVLQAVLVLSCLRKMAFFGEPAFRRAVASYVEHYHEERPHQSLENAPIHGIEQQTTGPVRCNERLGGILKHYSRAA